MNLVKHQVKIGGISCSFCVQTISKALLKIKGVLKVNVSLAHEEALIEYDPSILEPFELDETLLSLGYRVLDPRKVKTFEEELSELERERNRLLVSLSLAGISGILMLLIWLGYRNPLFSYAMLSLALTMIFIVGYPILRMALASLRRFILNQHVLLEFGAFAALVGGFTGFLIQKFPKADFFAIGVFVTTYHILSGYTSFLVRTKSSQAVRRLLSLSPLTARVMREGRERIVGIEELSLSELVRVKPGERIPVDGVVQSGSSVVDESLVTGESMSSEKTVSDEVIGGSINISGMITVKITRLGEESFLYQIANHIEEARALKPSILQLVDSVLKYYVPAVLIFSLLGFLTWSLGAWIFKGEPDFPRALFSALAVLVMGYPCALGMATPLAMIRGGGIAAERGILMRSSEAFQILGDIDKVVFDKTGTLTTGKPKVFEIFPLKGYGVKDVLEIAGSLENSSEHPLSKAILEKVREEGVKVKEVLDFQNHPGLGIEGFLNREKILVGNSRFMKEQGILIESFKEMIEEMEAKGETVMIVSKDERVVGLIGVLDEIKEDALKTIALLKEHGLQPVMLTGDNLETAKTVAERIGIKEVYAQVLPQKKAQKVRKLQERGCKVLMVGDGINDAPALMQADVGVAIGAGTDIAIESSDIILVGNRLSGVLEAIQIGKKSYEKTKQNLILAFSFNGVGVPLAATGLVHPVWAMVAMVLSVSTVLANSLRGRFRQKKGCHHLQWRYKSEGLKEKGFETWTYLGITEDL